MRERKIKDVECIETELRLDTKHNEQAAVKAVSIHSCEQDQF